MVPAPAGSMILFLWDDLVYLINLVTITEMEHPRTPGSFQCRHKIINLVSLIDMV